MRVSFESLLALPAHLPIPQFDGHVITSRQNEGLGRVNANSSYVVGVGLEAGDLF